jgi:cell division protein FtsB
MFLTVYRAQDLLDDPRYGALAHRFLALSGSVNKTYGELASLDRERVARATIAAAQDSQLQQLDNRIEELREAVADLERGLREVDDEFGRVV